MSFCLVDLMKEYQLQFIFGILLLAAISIYVVQWINKKYNMEQIETQKFKLHQSIKQLMRAKLYSLENREQMEQTFDFRLMFDNMVLDNYNLFNHHINQKVIKSVEEFIQCPIKETYKSAVEIMNNDLIKQ